jgi:hypothetical protein
MKEMMKAFMTSLCSVTMTILTMSALVICVVLVGLLLMPETLLGRVFNMCACVRSLDYKNWQVGLPYLNVSGYLSQIHSPKSAFPYIQGAVRVYSNKTNPDIKRLLEDYRLPINVVTSLVVKSGIQYNIDGMLEFINKFVDAGNYISSDYIKNHELKIFEVDLIWDLIYDGVQLVKQSDVIMGSELDNFIQFVEQIYEIFERKNIKYINIS